MNGTSSRLLSMLSLLQGRRDWPGAELAERLEVSRRTIRRDVERLRKLGYPVESLTGPAGGYRLASGAAMPPLLLDDDEAIAIAVGLRTAARASVTGIEETSVRALVKLEQVLPSRLRRRVAALGAATVTMAETGPTVDPQSLTVIASACRDAECVRFAYRGRDGVESRREVEPHKLVNLGRRWYLLAWDCGREDWRSFRVDRLSEPAATGVRHQRRQPPGRDAAKFVAKSISSAPQRYEARLTLKTPAALARKRFPAQWGAIEPIDDETCEYRTGDYDLNWLAVRITMFDVEFEVHEPPELIEHLRELAGRIERGVGVVRVASNRR